MSEQSNIAGQWIRFYGTEEERTMDTVTRNTRKFYVGTKVVEAWPEVKDGVPGYAVLYKDGYKSWSPKDTFEDAYRPLDEMKP